MRPTRSVKELRAEIRNTGGEQGIVLITSLLMMLLLTPLGTLFLTLSLTESMIASNQATVAQGFSIAEAGIEHAGKALESLDVSEVLDGTTTVFGGSNTANLAGGSYTVQVTNNIAVNGFPRGAIAADAGGSATVDDDRIVVVTSTGTVQGAQQSIETVMQMPFPFPNIPGAVVQVSNGWNEFDVAGTVSGFDESGTCTDQAGHVHKGGTVTIRGSTVEGNPASRDYDPAIDHPILDDPDRLVAMIERWMNNPDAVTITGPSPPTVLGTAANPQITVWDTTGHINSNAASSFTGYGILIIDGRFDLKSSFEFYGLIVAYGGKEMGIEGGNGQILHGAVLAANNDPSPSGDATDVEIEGGAQVQYNCSAITTYAGQAAGGGSGSGNVTVLSWKQE